uniref:Uncharacterized protein n=2 Tax=viral metagenome TaxID=1070528 RepID=A0A6H2A2I4_9ZZZZ
MEKCRMCHVYNDALKDAVALIQQWHNFHNGRHLADNDLSGWNIYYRRAPEMQKIRDLLGVNFIVRKKQP